MTPSALAIRTFMQSAGWLVVEEDLDQYREAVLNADPREARDLQLALVRYQIARELTDLLISRGEDNA